MVDESKLSTYVQKHFDFRPKALIAELGLLSPIYRATSAYGHFGRPEFSWEKTDRAEQLASDLLGKARLKSAVQPVKKAAKKGPLPGKPTAKRR